MKVASVSVALLAAAPSRQCLRFILSSLLCFAASVLGEQPPQFGWITRIGGEGDDYARGMVFDRSGNLYVTGSFASTNLSIGSTNLSKTENSAMFLAKFDPDGNLIWVRKSQAINSAGGNALAIDASTNIYVAGSFQTNVNFGAFSLASMGGIDAFVAKYNANGEPLWATNAGGPTVDSCLAIAVDASTNVYITGYFEGTATFGNTSLVSTGGMDAFIARLDDAGNFLWAQRGGGPYADSAGGVSTTPAGGAVICGRYLALANFGSFQLTGNPSASALFVVGYDSSGNVTWAQKAGPPWGIAYGYGTVTDGDGNTLVTGGFVGEEVNFGVTNLTSDFEGDYWYYDDAFVAKLTPEGNYLWANNLGSSKADAGRAIAVDPLGNSYLAGFWNRVPGSSTLDGDIFVAKFDGAGRKCWSIIAGGTDLDSGSKIAVDGRNRIYVSGHFKGSASFGNCTLTSSGGYDGFIAQLDPLPELSVTRLGNKILLTWLTNHQDFQLESAPMLATNGWSSVTNVSIIINGQFVVTNDVAGAHRFYRLHQP